MIRIAVLDDNRIHLQMVEQALIGSVENWGEPVEVLTYESGVTLLDKIKTEAFDCVILDRNVPDLSGDVILQWIRQYRKQDIPIIMLTSRKNGQELVDILTAGADEYLTKPFNPGELLIRVKRLVEKRRQISITMPAEPAFQINFNTESGDQIHHLHGAIFDDFNLTVNHREQLIKLTEREYNLAKILFENVGVNLSREYIMQKVWCRRDMGKTERTLTTHIHLVRDKLELTLEHGWALRPVYGFGYRLDVFKPKVLKHEVDKA